MQRASAAYKLWVFDRKSTFTLQYIFFLSNYNSDSIDTISLTLNNGGNCRKQKALLCPSVRPSVRAVMFVCPLVRTYLWFIYSRRCGVVCPTELGLLHFLKGMVFQVSELSQKQLLYGSATDRQHHLLTYYCQLSLFLWHFLQCLQ